MSRFEKNPFGDILKLIPHSEKVTKLNALCQICRDGTSASFTKRITNEKDVHLVGAESTYMAVCRKHYHSDKAQNLKRIIFQGAILNN